MVKPLELKTVRLEPGVTRIEASAGTGKTFAITGLLLRLLMDARVDALSEVLIVTFTEAATADLKNRVRRVLFDAASVLRGATPDEKEPLQDLVFSYVGRCDPAVFERALADLDRASIFTIHGFCRRLLEQMAFESGAPFSFEILSDSAELMDRAARDYWHVTVAADALLAQVAVDQDWDMASFQQLANKANRFPDTRLAPPAFSLSEALEELRRAVAALQSTWDAALFDRLCPAIGWNKPFKSGYGLRDDVRALTLDSVSAVASGRLVGHLAALEACTPEKIEEGRNKKRKLTPEVSVLKSSESALACERILAALEPLKRALEHDFIGEVRTRFDRFREERQVLSFDDLLRKVDAAIRDPQTGPLLVSEVNRHYRVALIDEFQDTDPLQYRIFSRLFAGQALFFIGDPKQAIYGFRGADLRTYLDAVRGADFRYTLDKNWRSEPALIGAVNEIFGHHSSPFLDPEIRFEPVGAGHGEGFAVLTGDPGAPLQFRFVPPREDGKAWSKEEANDIIGRFISAEVGRIYGLDIRIGDTVRQVERSDIGILVRTHRQAQSVQRALRRAGIHSVVSKSGNVLATSEAGELALLLRALLDPRRGGTVRAVLAGTLFGHTAATLKALSDDEEEWRWLTEKMQEWQRIWYRRGIARLLSQVALEEGIYERLLRLEDGERRATNLRHLTELLHAEERARSLGPDALLSWLQSAMAEPGDQKDLFFLRLESDDEAAKIATVHSAKGLEYPIVFAPYLWDAMPPNPKEPLLVQDESGHTLHLAPLAPDDPAFLAADRDRLAEEMRLAYVALTRARARCYVIWGYIGRDDSAFSAAAYLLHGNGLSTNEHVIPGQVATALKASVPTWRADLEALAASAPQTISVQDLDTGLRPERSQSAPGETDPAALQARSLPEPALTALQPWEMSSFSALTASAVHFEVDPDADPDLPGSPAVSPVGAFAFAKGTRTGLCLHHLLETLDFRALSHGDPEAQDAVRRAIEEYGLREPSIHEAPIDPVEVATEMLRATVTRPLPGAGFALSDLDRRRRLDEWRFHLPIRDHISLADLAPNFERNLTPSLVDAYVPHLRAGSDRPVRGYVTGSADLVFEHEGKWYLVDWKTNHLGYERSEYGTESVVRAMSDHHYILQYHLYLTALDRYLAWRVPEYTYEQHVGGVWYIFLRGVGSDDDQGFFFDRPSAHMVASLGGLLSSPVPHTPISSR